MQNNQGQSELAAALAKAQADMQNAPLNRVNSHYKSKYADLAAIRDAVTPALTKHGLAVTQTPTFHGETFVLVTTLRHVSGETVESVYPLPLDKPQVMGSALSYARRYSLAAMCGIAAEEDDDANAAQTGDAKAQAPKRQNTVRQPEDAADIKSMARDWVQQQLDHIATFEHVSDLEEWLDKPAISKGIAKLEAQEPELHNTLLHGIAMIRDGLNKMESAA